MSRQQNKRTIGSSKSCVDLIFHPPQKKTQKRMRSRKENIRKNKSRYNQKFYMKMHS